MDTWKKHSVGELRIIAKAYKKHTMVGAVGKMKKGELITLLDKHLLIDDAGMIKVRPMEMMPLKGPNIQKVTAENEYKKKLGKVQREAQKKLVNKMQKDEDMMKEAEAYKKEKEKDVGGVTLEEQARADEIKRMLSSVSMHLKEVMDKM